MAHLFGRPCCGSRTTSPAGPCRPGWSETSAPLEPPRRESSLRSCRYRAISCKSRSPSRRGAGIAGIALPGLLQREQGSRANQPLGCAEIAPDEWRQARGREPRKRARPERRPRSWSREGVRRRSRARPVRPRCRRRERRHPERGAAPEAKGARHSRRSSVRCSATSSSPRRWGSAMPRSSTSVACPARCSGRFSSSSCCRRSAAGGNSAHGARRSRSAAT